MIIRIMTMDDYDAVHALWLSTPGMGLNDIDDSRGGIGTALLDAALDALRAEGIHKVALVVFKRNALGNAFWAARGFEAREDLVYRNLALSALRRIDT